jgi:hypothetical protein
MDGLFAVATAVIAFSGAQSCDLPPLPAAERREARQEMRRQERRRRIQAAPDLQGYRDGPRLRPPSKRERRRIRVARSVRRGFGLNPSRLLIRRLFRADRSQIVLRDLYGGQPLTPVEARDVGFQVFRVIQSQGRVERYGRRCAPDAYAGVYPISRWPEGITLQVLFTRNVGAHAHRLRRLHRYAPLLRFRTVRFTKRELLALQERIDDDWEQLERDGIDISATGIDVAHNAVVIYMPEPTRAARAELRRRYGRGVRVVRGEFENLDR